MAENKSILVLLFIASCSSNPEVAVRQEPAKASVTVPSKESATLLNMAQTQNDKAMEVCSCKGSSCKTTSLMDFVAFTEMVKKGNDFVQANKEKISTDDLLLYLEQSKIQMKTIRSCMDAFQ
jgi:hypothetical protein